MDTGPAEARAFPRPPYPLPPREKPWKRV